MNIPNQSIAAHGPRTHNPTNLLSEDFVVNWMMTNQQNVRALLLCVQSNPTWLPIAIPPQQPTTVANEQLLFLSVHSYTECNTDDKILSKRIQLLKFHRTGPWRNARTFQLTPYSAFCVNVGHVARIKINSLRKSCPDFFNGQQHVWGGQLNYYLVVSRSFASPATLSCRTGCTANRGKIY